MALIKLSMNWARAPCSGRGATEAVGGAVGGPAGASMTEPSSGGIAPVPMGKQGGVIRLQVIIVHALCQTSPLSEAGPWSHTRLVLIALPSAVRVPVERAEAGKESVGRNATGEKPGRLRRSGDPSPART